MNAKYFVLKSLVNSCHGSEAWIWIMIASVPDLCILSTFFCLDLARKYQRTNGPVNAHLISWPSKAQNIHNLENMW